MLLKQVKLAVFWTYITSACITSHNIINWHYHYCQLFLYFWLCGSLTHNHGAQWRIFNSCLLATNIWLYRWSIKNAWIGSYLGPFNWTGICMLPFSPKNVLMIFDPTKIHSSTGAASLCRVAENCSLIVQISAPDSYVRTSTFWKQLGGSRPTLKSTAFLSQASPQTLAGSSRHTLTPLDKL